MTHERDIEHILDHWFTDGPSEAPDRVLETVADRIERQTQQPAWRLQWRDSHVNTYLKPLLAIAAVVVVAVVGIGVIANSGSSTGVGGPSPASSPMALPSPPTALAAGRYAAYPDSDAPFTFAVPTGWTMLDDLALLRTDGPTGDVVMFWGSMRIAAKDAACPEAPEPGIGHTAAELIADMAANPALAASAPRPISVGGLNGQMIDVAIAPGWTRSCPSFTDGKPVVSLITDVDPASGPIWGVKDQGKIRVIAIDIAGGENFVITVDSLNGVTLDSTVAAAMPVIESMVFGSGN